ncbi:MULTISPECIES: aldo/keto reductase [Mammaliicoccus]|uniref:Aldo/keto reductase n=1 Tax=Mammaliicoccus sciuri TaxID=1296 RepID=A0AB37HJ51_MAMSC|nr:MULTISPECIES: aldo/keto reductase [Mammaliicoccus]RXY84792.1 aldo/keto reductase [Salmonella sp. 3DZ2-4SM]ARB41382.1 aldo/keto reductase [Mammaliicoccus sciuri]MCE5040846.1 aldo/keto reductase [Mammaliicoccus sciuri]MDT0668455.1 aldo/keto reductase [Mammaliicoccus sciuri]MEB5759496.1 aldo/keto reductase [Mammaliicoccus sciuri]
MVKLNNNVEIPELGLGVYKIEDADVERVIHTAIDAGYRAIDTAWFYKNEKALGEALKTVNIKREDLFITTKLWNDFQGYDATIKAFNDSLESLQLTYIDMYLIHWPCPEDGLFIETYKALETLYKEGKIKAIGVCNFKEHHLDQLLAETEVVPAVNQVEFHPLFNQKALQAYCESKGIKLMAWSPLMRGGEWLNNADLQSIADQYNKTVAQVIIKWHLQQGRLVIPKSQNDNRIRENFDVFDFELSDEDLAKIDQLNTDERQFRDPDEVKIGDMK